MSYRPFRQVLEQLRRLSRAPAAAEPEDRLLLERFLRERDQDAFESLVRRHGPMVLGVCGRILQNGQDAEDAFQATFVVLVRRARSLRRRERLAGWLHGVAYRTALKARTLAARRQAREKRAARAEVQPEADLRWHDLRPVLDEELNRLPAGYRLPLVLCYLEGRTLAEAGRELGWPAGTVSGRLYRARELLRSRLTRRGVTLSAGLVTTLLCERAQGTVSSSLFTTTLQAGLHLAAGTAAGVNSLSPSVLTLTEGVLRAMFLTKVKIATAIVLSIGLLGAGLLAYPGLAGQQADPREVQPPGGQPRVQGVDPALQFPAEVDEMVPELATLGEKKVKALLETSKMSAKLKALLKERYDAARTEMDGRRREFLAGRGTLDITLGASLRLLEAERELDARKDNQVAALENHWKRMCQVEQVNKERFQAGRIAIQDLSESTFYRAQAEIWLERAREGGA